MSLHIALLAEGMAALLALEGPRLEVRADVVDRVAKLCKATVTLETGYALVGPPRVLIENEDFLEVLRHLLFFL